MLLFRRNIVLVFCLALFLQACGFKPLYTTQDGVSISPSFGEIKILSIPNKDGQFLRNLLIDRIYTEGRPANTRYSLKIKSVKETTSRLGIRKDASATRAQLRLTAGMILIDHQSNNETVLKRDIKSVVSFNILDNQYATLITEQDARERALNEISNDVIMQLSLFFNRS